MPEIIGLRHYWNHDSIRPGGVGSVGDVLVTPRVRRSTPDMPVTFEAIFAKRQGSKVTKQPYVTTKGMGGKRDFRINHGWLIQDLRKPATSTEPTLQSIGDYSWQNRIASVVNAKRTGSLFLPLPGNYQLKEGQIPRGGLLPTVTTAGGTNEYRTTPKNSVVDNTKGSFGLPKLEP